MYFEDEFTELKVELTKDIKKEIVAFANTNGGKIYIGIADGGKVISDMKCCQLYYYTVCGQITNTYNGSMQNLTEVGETRPFTLIKK